MSDKVTFVNVDLEFSKSSLEKKVFPDGLVVLNDLALQANALHTLGSDSLSYIGDNLLNDKKVKRLKWRAFIRKAALSSHVQKTWRW